MKCLIVGPGGIGLSVGAALAQAGHEVSFAGRSAFDRLKVGKQDDDIANYMTWPVKSYQTPDDVPDMDWILLCTKAHQTKDVGGYLSKAPNIAVLQNGVEHVAVASPFARDGAKILPVIVGFSGTRTAPGQAFYILRNDSDLSTDDAGFAALFDGSFLTPEVIDDITTRMWRKLCWNAATGAVLGLTRGRMGTFHEPGVADTALRILEETVAVGRAEGAKFPDTVIDDQMRKFLNSPADEYNSMVLDVENGVECEWDARNAVLCRLGRKHGIPTPYSDFIVPLLSVLHKGTR